MPRYGSRAAPGEAIPGVRNPVASCRCAASTRGQRLPAPCGTGGPVSGRGEPVTRRRRGEEAGSASTWRMGSEAGHFGHGEDGWLPRTGRRQRRHGVRLASGGQHVQPPPELGRKKKPARTRGPDRRKGRRSSRWRRTGTARRPPALRTYGSKPLPKISSDETPSNAPMSALAPITRG